MNRETGQVLDKTQVPYAEESLVLFTGEGEKADWRLLKVRQSCCVSPALPTWHGSRVYFSLGIQIGSIADV